MNTSSPVNKISANKTKPKPKQDMIVLEYLRYYEEFSRKYNKETTLVLMQVGSFYESYATNERGPNLANISNLMNVTLTRKNKSIPEIDEGNPYLVGVPVVSIQKYMDKLIQNGFTVIIIDQKTGPPNIKREVTGVYSAGTHIDGSMQPDANYVLCIYFETEKQKKGPSMLCSGMSAIDLSTGTCKIHEALSESSDNNFAADETVRFLNSLNPNEIIIFYDSNNAESINIIEGKTLPYLELDTKSRIVKTSIDRKNYNIIYQNELLKKIYKNTGHLSPIEYLNLDRLNYARVALILLLDFIHDHSIKISAGISKPELFLDNKKLILGNNALQQLNVIGSNFIESYGKRIKCLFDVVNNTSTHMGRRYLRDRLVSPLTCKETLSKIYDYTEQFIKEKFYRMIEDHLYHIADMERLERRLYLGIIRPYELMDIYFSCQEGLNIIKLLKYKQLMTDPSTKMPSDEIITKIEEFLTYIKWKFDIEMAKKYSYNNIDASFFNDGIYADIDKLKIANNKGHTFLYKLCEEVSKYIPESRNKIGKNKISDKKYKNGEYILSISKNKSATLKENFRMITHLNVDGIIIKMKDISITEANKNLDSIKIKNPQEMAGQTTESEVIIERTKKYFSETVIEVAQNFGSVISELSKFISYVDYIKSNAKTAILYNYTKPTISDDDTGFISCVQLRHPIIERIIDYEYIPHDVDLGKSLKGMLVYGLNSAGKCFHKDTEIMLSNGQIKKAINIVIGDKLMGDDMTERNVLSTTNGKGEMYKISGDFKPFIVNGPHILCLRENEEIIEISVDEYLNKDKEWQNKYKMYKSSGEVYEFSVERIGEDNYYGFEIDGNKRFLLSDGIVTHNSSIMKSLGLSVIMAQAGLYVPARSYTYCPYSSIYTRITSQDNLFKGLSSFALEMVELNSILVRSNENTLVIGDEVCKGTEYVSANSLVAATISHLAKVNASFIFATHLHDIVNIEYIKNLPSVKAYHLSVEYDHKSDSLIYSRELKEGPGEPIYGIIFAKHIIHNNTFIEEALKIKDELMKSYPNLISGKTSRYNSELLVYECQICGKSDKKTHVSPLETHHINFQKDCKGGFSVKNPHIGKNSLANLIVLCNECHDKLHEGEFKIDGYVMTSKGKSVRITKGEEKILLSKA